ncbi:MAG: hypothetical protein HZA95_02265 [Candidatus Vogelbacteria bacterium]|nr:hypothetical protein [Candidatus Vogelbacteria bacterium]
MTRIKTIYSLIISTVVLSCTNRVLAASDLNPLSVETIDELIVIILDAAIKIGVPIVTFFILLTGFKYATARGDKTKITNAHQMLQYTIIGTAIVVGAKIIHSVLKNTLLQLTA